MLVESTVEENPITKTTFPVRKEGGRRWQEKYQNKNNKKKYPSFISFQQQYVSDLNHPRIILDSDNQRFETI